MQQLIDLKRLADEIPGAALDRLDRILDRAESGDDDGNDVGIAFDGRFQHVRAVQAGQPQIGNDDVERKLRQSRDRGFAGIGLFHLVPAVRQLLRDSLAQRRLVFDEQHMFRRVRHLAMCQHLDTLRADAAVACAGYSRNDLNSTGSCGSA